MDSHVWCDYKCAMTDSYVRNDAFTRVTWLVHTCYMRHCQMPFEGIFEWGIHVCLVCVREYTHKTRLVDTCYRVMSQMIYVCQRDSCHKWYMCVYATRWYVLHEAFSNANTTCLTNASHDRIWGIFKCLYIYMYIYNASQMLHIWKCLNDRIWKCLTNASHDRIWNTCEAFVRHFQMRSFSNAIMWGIFNWGIHVFLVCVCVYVNLWGIHMWLNAKVCVCITVCVCMCLYPVCEMVCVSARPYELCKNIQGLAPPRCPFEAVTTVVQIISARQISAWRKWRSQLCWLCGVMDAVTHDLVRRIRILLDFWQQILGTVFWIVVLNDK